MYLGAKLFRLSQSHCCAVWMTLVSGGRLSPLCANSCCALVFALGRPSPSRSERLKWRRIIRGHFRRDKADLHSLIPTALWSLRGLAVTSPKALHFTERERRCSSVATAEGKWKTLISRLSLSGNGGGRGGGRGVQRGRKKPGGGLLCAGAEPSLTGSLQTALTKMV